MKNFYYPPKKEIIYLKSDKNYTELYLADGNTVISSSTLLRHQERLGTFLRVSKSHLLNPFFIESVTFNGDKNEVRLKNGKRVKVSRRRKNILKKIF